LDQSDVSIMLFDALVDGATTLSNVDRATLTWDPVYSRRL
jgi:hypothetical protein